MRSSSFGRRYDHVIDLDSDNEPSAAPGLNLGNSFLVGLDPKGNRPPIDRSAAMRAREAYSPARSYNKAPPPSEKYSMGSVFKARSAPSFDSRSMKADYTLDEENAGFKAEYVNACGYSDDENSNDDLFVSPTSATTSR